MPDPVDAGVWELRLPDTEPRLIAFDRDTVDGSERDVTLFTWGTEEAVALRRLLSDDPTLAADDAPNWAGELIPDETKLPL